MKTSAGILLFKKNKNDLLFFLVHPGGPFWKNKDRGAWSIPKGELAAGEDPLERACTEFREETGQAVHGIFLPLSPVQQKGGKRIIAWALEGDIDTTALSSNSFTLEWPPRSGSMIAVPEVDRWEWFSGDEAQQRINPAQVPLLNEVQALSTQ
ncbi:NUDIX hydrolase [Niabella beijingensis]|uniref:NUDIX hydrolase n=1 Tax=Niabella beijingensis TaxID=2872700 RepID=UPI001CBE2C3C|nr:NUDIX domain-containing protein [Niabella beijingensis]